jgi:PKD repeat protein
VMEYISGAIRNRSTMSKAYQVGYPLLYNPVSEKYEYTNRAGNSGASINRLVVAGGKGVVGSWLGFTCSFNYENARPLGGFQNNFQTFLGAFFASSPHSTTPISGAFMGPTLYAPNYRQVWRTPTAGFGSFNYTLAPFDGFVFAEVTNHRGGDYYDVYYTIRVNQYTFSTLESNVYIPSNKGVVFCCGGNEVQPSATATIYNIDVAEDWRLLYEEATDPPKKNICEIGKKNCTAPLFKAENYSALVNCTVSSNSLRISNGGYSASPAVPQLGATHHIVKQYVVSALTGSQWNNYIGWYGESDTTLRGDVRISGIVAALDSRSFHVWGFGSGGCSPVDLAYHYTYPNKGACVLAENTYVLWVSVKRVFDDVVTAGYIYSTVIVDVYDALIVYAHFEYRSREPYTGTPVRFVSQVNDTSSLAQITTVYEQVIGTTGLPDDCRGSIYADFTAAPSVGTIPMHVLFINQSVALRGITSYVWSFGNGKQSTEENPTFTFEQIGKFSVTLTVYGPDGQDTIRKFEYVIAERRFMKKCLHYGISEEHGPGWSERGGDNWVWPESQAAIFTIINNSYRQEIVIDENDGLPYCIDTRDGPFGSGLIKRWKDKVDPLIEGSGTLIDWEILFGEYTGELEQYFVEMLETYMVFRTINTENIGQGGYDTYGLPTTLQVNYDLLKDGLLIPYAGATQIPIKRDIVVDRKAKGNALQIKLTGQNAEFKLRKIESSLKVSDFAHNTTSMTEIGYQEILSNPVMWFTRESNMVDRCTGMSMFNSAGLNSFVTGPDGRDDSAFRIIGTLDVRNPEYASGTLMLWHKTGYTISGVGLTEIGQAGDWILSYSNNVPASLLFTNGDVFDIRVFSIAVPLAAMQHYFENVSEHNGDMYLP